MKPLICCVALVLTGLPVAAQACDDRSRECLTAWEEDLDQLATTIKTKHVSPYHQLEAGDLEARVAAARRTLASRPLASDRAVALVRVAAAVGDGHTNVRPWDRFHALPLRWAWMEGALRVTAVPAGREALLGATVTRIGKVSVSEAQRRVAELIPAGESPNFVLNWSQYLLRMPEVLHALDIVNRLDTVEVELAVASQRGTKRSKTTFTPVTAAESDGLRLVRPYATPPLALSRPGEDLWHARVPGTGMVYLNFAGYPAREAFIAQAKALIATLGEPGVTSLFVDLRDNGGGDFKSGRRFIEFIRPRIEERALRVYIGIGRQTFSAGMTNATDFKKQFAAPYIGEVSGARPVGFQENLSFVLARSGLPGSVAQQHYAFQDADTAGLQPDHPVAWSWQDYAAGRDAVLEKALALESERR